MAVDTHFDKEAEKYDQQRTSGLIGGLVKKEEAIAMDFLDVQEGESIVDIGAGSGHYSMQFKQLGAEVLGIDISEKMVAALKHRGVTAMQGNIENLSLDREFDKALCAGALEFVEDVDKALAAIGGMVKSGGVFVWVYPRASFGGMAYKAFHMTHGVRVKLFSKVWIEEHLEKFGFKVEEFKDSTLLSGVVKARKE